MSDLGTLGFPGATGEDHLLRQIADLRRAQRELGPSIAKSFTGTTAALQSTIDDLAGVVGDVDHARADLARVVADLATVVAAQRLDLLTAQIWSDSSFPLTATSFTARGSTSMTAPAGGQALVLSGSAILRGGTTSEQSRDQVIEQRLVVSHPVPGGGRNNEVVMLPSLVMPRETGVPNVVHGGGAVSWTGLVAPGTVTITHEVSSLFGGYVGVGYLMDEFTALVMRGVTS